MTESLPNCPNCGKPLTAVALQGLCPECLIQAGWPTEDGPEGSSETRGTPFVPPALDEIKGLFPQLEILELIGKGGMGAVYKARQPDLDRLVALKILAPRHQHDPGFAERFTREARALARLSHPHIVNVYDFGHKGDLNYFVMEFVDGPNLREVERAGQLSSQEALAIVPQICAALQFAHDEGVVHRDIKPENILLDRKGRVKIADFGLAKIMGRDARHLTLTQDGHVMGTPHYMAPEQVEHPHDVDHRADIYSLGVVFYELLTGELPLGKFAPPSRKVQVDVRLDEVVLKTLEKEPALRYQQVNQVGTEVETIASGVCVTKDGQRRSEESAAEIERSLRIPATGLFVSGCLNIGICLLAALSVLTGGFLPGVIEIALVLIVACLALVVLKGATCMRRQENYRLSVMSAVLAIILSLGTFVGMLFGGWALILLTRKEVRAAFQAKQGHKHTPPDWQWAARVALWTTAVHTIPLFLVGVFLVLVVPKYLALYSNMAMPIPTFSRAAFVLAGFLNAYGLFVLLALLIGDAIVLWPLCAYGGRRACRWWSIAVMGVLVFVVGGTVAGIRLPLQRLQMNHDQRLAAVDSQLTYPFIARFPRGTVELLGVCEHPSAGHRWWAPDGSPVLDDPAIVNSGTVYPGKNERAREFLVRTAGLPDHASGLVLRVKDAGSSAGYTVEDVNGRHLPDLVATSVILPDHLVTTDMTVGIALDPWETIVTRDGRGSGMETTYADGRNWDVSVMEAVEIQGDTRITVAHTVGREWEVRMVAQAGTGEVTANGTSSQSTEGMSHVTFTYSGLSLEAIKRFSFQVRPYIWATFENVSLVSGQRTAVRIRHARDPLPLLVPTQGVVAGPDAEGIATRVSNLELGMSRPVRLSPIVERVVTDNGVGGRRFIDLDTGVLFASPMEVDGADESFVVNWMRTKGIDVMGNGGLLGLDMIVLPADVVFWENIAPAGIRERLSKGARGTLNVISGSGHLPGTYLFQTREGGAGILQILGYSDDPRGIRIRYRRIETEPDTVTPAPAEATAVEPAVPTGPRRFDVTLANGLHFDVLSVARNPKFAPVWIKPDGTLLQEAPLEVTQWRSLDIVQGKDLPAPENQFLLHYRTDTSGMAVCESRKEGLAIEPKPAARAMVFAEDGDGRPAYPEWIDYHDPPASVDLRIKSAAGPWETVHEYDPGNAPAHNRGGIAGGGRPMVQWGPPIEISDREVEYMVMHDIDKQAYALRVMAYLRDGRVKSVVFHSGLLRRVPTQGFVRLYTEEIKPEDVKKFALERTPWVSGVVKGIRLPN